MSAILKHVSIDDDGEIVVSQQALEVLRTALSRQAEG
jgi:hypothetical protein